MDVDRAARRRAACDDPGRPATKPRRQRSPLGSHRLTRRCLLRTTATAGIGGVIGTTQLRRRPALLARSTALPVPVDTGRALEICLNSRTAHHGALGGRAGDQQLAHVLWAARRAPVTGARRTLHVATPVGTFVDHPEGRALWPESS